MLPVPRKIMVALGAGDTMFDQILAAQQGGQSAAQLARNITQAQLDSLGGAVQPKPKPATAPVVRYAMYAGLLGAAYFMWRGMSKRR